MYNLAPAFYRALAALCLLCARPAIVPAQQKVLIVTSNQDFYGHSQIAAANHFEEIVVPYDIFVKAGLGVDFVSPKGGAVPLDYFNTSDSLQKKYLYDGFFMDKLEHTLPPSAVNASDYSAVFFSGGGAAMFGVAENQDIQRLARQIYTADGVVSAICHGTAGLAYLKDEAGKSLYNGRKITGFPDKFENRNRAYYKTFPFVMDQAVKNNGGDFVYSDKGWDGFYVVDGRFVTGQDPSSAAKMAREIVGLIATGTSARQKETVQRIDKAFSAWNDPAPKPGVAAGLLKNGQTIYLKGFGAADLRGALPVHADTKFQLGAMSKQFTAFAILLLEEQGKLSLSDDVRKYLPQMPDFGHKITIRHLLSQSSGLPDLSALKDVAGWSDQDVFTHKDALQLIFQQRKLDHVPGTKFSQTSTGLVLLAEIVQQATGQTLADFAQTHIFQPLGMTHTAFRDDRDRLVSDAAIPYRNGKEATPNHIVGLTNIYTSVADLSRWYLNFERRQVGSPKLLEKLWTPVTLDDGVTTFNPVAGRLLYGQQHLHAERGVPKIWAYGLENGYASNIFIFPQQQVVSFVLGNNDQYNGGLAMNMALEALGDVFPEPPSIDFSKVKTVAATPRQLEGYAGHYWDGERVAGRKIYVKNDTLRYQALGGGAESTLLPVGEGVFQMVVDGDDRILVKFRKEGDDLKMIYTSGESDEYAYNRYQPADYTAAALEEFAGTFYSEALQTTYTLARNEKGLFTANKKYPLVQLVPVRPDLFASTIKAFSGVRFVRDAQQKITGFYVDSDRAKNLFFQKVNGPSERAQIETVLTHYIEGTANGEPERLRTAFDPGFNLYSVAKDTLRTWSGQAYIGNFKPGEKTNRIGRILFIDIEKDAAVAKAEIVVPGWRIFTDYFLLLKYGGAWRIVHKSYSWREQQAEQKG